MVNSMISTDDIIKWLLRAIATVSLLVMTYFIKDLINEVKAKPTVGEVEFIIRTRLDPIRETQHKDRERIIKVEQAVVGILSINNKLDGLDSKLDKACEDIAAIKAKQ